MRLKIALRISKIFLILVGAAFLGAAVLAVQLGIDHNAAWGKGRILMAVIGIAALFACLGLHFWGTFKRWSVGISETAAARAVSTLASRIQAYNFRINRRLKSLPPICWLENHPHFSGAIAGGAGAAITLLIYLWYITSGTLVHWFPYTAYFDHLGEAFLAGQLSLPEKPPAELLALTNPYDYHNRAGIGYLWDASLYQGRYYYYWGPVPGMLAAGVKGAASLLSGAPLIVEDQYLLFFFCSGMVVMLALILALIRKAFFPHAPTWTLMPLVMLGGLAVPVLWLINRPSVYETAIAGGQFFLLLGLYAALKAVTQNTPANGWLLLAGLAWGAAVNCRLNLALAVIFFTLVITYQLFQSGKPVRQSMRGLLWLGFPLAAWAVGMGWYNFARFGSLLETGHRYQLTGPALPVNYNSVTSLAYVIPSLYSYLFRPLQVTLREFPFVFAPFIKESMWPFFIHLPKDYYYPEPVAGILAAVPGVWVAFVPLLSWMRRGWLWLNERVDDSTAVTPAWLWVLIGGGSVCLFAPLLVFISTSMRYLADVTPMTTLLAALGLWWGCNFLRERSSLRGWIIFIAMVLILITVLISLLANFTNGDKRFMMNNPVLYHAITHIFRN